MVPAINCQYLSFILKVAFFELKISALILHNTFPGKVVIGETCFFIFEKTQTTKGSEHVLFYTKIRLLLGKKEYFVRFEVVTGGFKNLLLNLILRC